MILSFQHKSLSLCWENNSYGKKFLLTGNDGKDISNLYILKCISCPLSLTFIFFNEKICCVYIDSTLIQNQKGTN